MVARLAASGRSNREIADELVVSIKTIEYHLRNAFGKLGVSSRRSCPTDCPNSSSATIEPPRRERVPTPRKPGGRCCPTIVVRRVC